MLNVTGFEQATEAVMPKQSATYQWRKRGRAVNFASPGVPVQPVILGRADNSPAAVQVKRTYETAIQRVMMMLTGDIFSRVMTHLGREYFDDDRVYFEKWTTPHPHGVGFPLHYVFGADRHWSGPLSVSTAAVTTEIRSSSVSAGLEHSGATLQASRAFEGTLQGKIGADRDPTFKIDCITPYTLVSVRSYIEDYMKELSNDLYYEQDIREDLVEVAFREYANYLGIGKESVGMEVSVRNQYVTVAENLSESFEIDVSAGGPGCMAFVLIVSDESSGARVASPLVGLRATGDGVIHVGFD